jgi:hypothetical protein
LTQFEQSISSIVNGKTSTIIFLILQQLGIWRQSAVEKEGKSTKVSHGISVFMCNITKLPHAWLTIQSPLHQQRTILLKNTIVATAWKVTIAP